jgi:hypothetical protein
MRGTTPVMEKQIVHTPAPEPIVRAEGEDHWWLGGRGRRGSGWGGSGRTCVCDWARGASAIRIKKTRIIGAPWHGSAGILRVRAIVSIPPWYGCQPRFLNLVNVSSLCLSRSHKGCAIRTAKMFLWKVPSLTIASSHRMPNITPWLLTSLPYPSLTHTARSTECPASTADRFMPLRLSSFS